MKAFEATDSILNGFSELLIVTGAESPALCLLAAATQTVVF